MGADLKNYGKPRSYRRTRVSLHLIRITIPQLSLCFC